MFLKKFDLWCNKLQKYVKVKTLFYYTNSIQLQVKNWDIIVYIQCLDHIECNVKNEGYVGSCWGNKGDECVEEFPIGSSHKFNNTSGKQNKGEVNEGNFNIYMLERGDVDSRRNLKVDVENYVLLSTSINQNQMRTPKHTLIRSHKNKPNQLITITKRIYFSLILLLLYIPSLFPWKIFFSSIKKCLKATSWSYLS